MKKTEKEDFKIISTLRGIEVIYKSPTTFKKWRLLTTAIDLTNRVMNKENPKRKDMDILKKICKKFGKRLE